MNGDTDHRTWLLLREVSAYESPSLLLGAFPSPSAAEASRRDYLEHLEGSQTFDDLME